VKRVNLTQLISRINTVGKVIDQKIKTTGKVHANGIVKTFQNKLANGDFTPKLKASTVAQKRRKGQPMPSTPLYGWGDSEKNSMINGLKVKQEAPAKWTVRPSGNHGKISMQKLFAIHEYGANLKNGGKIHARKPIRRSIEAYTKSTEYLRENHKLLKSVVGQVAK
jgi:hypothetical protein